MTDFRLKDCQEIKIRRMSHELFDESKKKGSLPLSLNDDDDVERIKILNTVVWEKNKNTVTTLTASSNNVLYGNSFTLTTSTTLEQNGNTSTIVDGTVKFYEGKNLISTKTTSNGTAKLTITGINSATYEAVFSKEKYKDSSASVNVQVNKKTPTLSNVGAGTVYKTWYIGAKLTSDGKPLSSKTVKIIINGVTHKKTTDANGVAKLKINLSPGKYTATYKFEGDKNYQSVNMKRAYTVNDYKTTTLSVDDVSGVDDNDKRGNNQRWLQVSKQEYHCYKNNVKCYATTNTIATARGTHKKPATLIINFKRGNINTIYEAKLTFTSNQTPACSGAYGGGLFEKGPDIGFNPGNGYKPIVVGKAFSKWRYYQNYHASKGPVNEKIIWSCDNERVNSLLKIKIDYPSNSGSEEGYLTIKNLKLAVSYIPTQSALK